MEKRPRPYSLTQNIPVPGISFPTGKSCLLYPRKPRTTQLFRVSPWSRLRSTAHFHLLLTQGGRTLLLTGENHTHGFMQRQLMLASLLACLRCGAGRTSLRRSPACCVNIHLELKQGFAVIVDVLRKHFRETSLKDTDEGHTILSALLPSPLKGPVLPLIKSDSRSDKCSCKAS